MERNTSMQQGIALVQVLIISFILALLGIFINQSVQQQVDVTKQIQNKFAMRLELEEAETQLFTALLAYNKYPNTSSENSVVKNWNFYGKEFKLTDSTYATLTDTRALVGLNINNASLVKKTLLQLNVDEAKAEQFVSSLLDWIDENDNHLMNGAESAYYSGQGKHYQPRDHYLQSINEVKLIRGAEQVALKQFKQYFTTDFVGGFNPLNAPELILHAFIKDDTITNKVIERRKNGTLNSLDFYRLTGVDEGEFITFATANKIRVQLRTVLNGAQLTKQYTLDASPRTYRKPMSFYKVSWNKS
ncbi:type II secretion system protein GspK [Pseudoalteromonas shioyasakiensis]|uniref:general secretion pathway protein GspK n=1 Tax=Pseudoalteromonas shioyasakiensis TaxID=1190813 RepID=UPI002119A366|nr:type II secretion system protein GspK [Pseudoalteromonas shioyasakiensis]MCQ8879457.1 type II secretion system protein GspK [Pseudoalteromonas shioyasakiensis]